MSEYNKFLKYFNKDKDDNEPLSEKEDIIPLKDSAAFKTSEKDVQTEAAEVISEQEKAAPEEKEEVPGAESESAEAQQSEESLPETEQFDEITLKTADPSEQTSAFIKSTDAQYIAVNTKNRSDIPTTAEKYTDRLLPKIHRKKSEVPTPPAKSSYELNHAPESENNFIRPEKEEEDKRTVSAEQTAKSTNDESVKIFTIGNGTDTKAAESPSGATKHISKKGELLRKIAKSSDEGFSEKDEDQMTMEGFGDDEDIPVIDTSDDEELNRELKRVREKRIKNFKFWTKAAEETGESEDKSFSPKKEEKQLPAFLEGIRKRFSHLDTDFLTFSEDEYSDPSRRKEIFSSLLDAKKSVIIKAAAIALIGIILTLINISVTVSAAINNGFFLVLGGSSVAYSAINLICLIICSVLMLDDLKKGLFSVLKIRPKTDSALLFIYLTALAQTIASFFSELKPEYDYHLLSGAAILLSVPVLLAKMFYYDNTRHCFKVAAAAHDKCYMRKVSDRDTVASILKDRDTGNANLVYTGKTRFISGFLKRSAASAFAGQVSSRVVVLSVAAAVISGIIGFITTKSVVYAFGCMCTTSAISFPVSCLVFTGFALKSENSVLSVKSSFIGSYSDTYSFGCIDNILLNGEDIFSAEIVSSSCAKQVPSKQAEFCAAVLTSKSGGMLGKAFSVFSSGLEDKYPDVESLEIAEKLGISAWISDCKVLLGTKEFLENHNVELPTDHSIPFISNEDTRPLFLAIEGHFAAVFSVKYSCDPTAAKSLCALAAKGTNIILSISDPNITESFGEELMGLPENSLRLSSDRFGTKFELQRSTITNSEDTGIVFADSFTSFARTMSGAVRLEKLRRAAKSLCEAASIAGILIGLIAAATGAQILLSAWPIIIVHACRILLSFILTPALCSTSLTQRIVLPANTAARTRNADSSFSGSLDDLLSDNGDKAEKKDEEPKAEEKEPETMEYEQKTDAAATAPEAAEQPKDPSQSEKSQTEDFVSYELPPLETIDFTSITGDEPVAEEETVTDKTVSDDILDMFAGSAERKAAHAPASRKPKKQGILSRLGLFIDTDDDSDKPARRSPTAESTKKSVFSFKEDNIPAPPRYDLKKEEEDKNDPLKATFSPPENDAPSALYTDDFFASFDTKEDDKVFGDIRRKRQEEEDGEGEFDFWTKK